MKNRTVRQEAGSLLDLPVHVAIAQLVQTHLDFARTALKRMRRGNDPEALHDFRVSLRRLRSTLQAYQPYLTKTFSAKQQRKVGRLAGLTGAGRDAEVHLAWLEAHQHGVTAAELPGYCWLTASVEAGLDGSHERKQAAIARRFKKRERRLRRKLQKLRKHDAASGRLGEERFSAAFGRVLPAYVTALETHLGRVQSAHDTTEAHRARIRAKRLRYLLEPVRGEVAGAEDLVAQLKHLQDILGELHDGQILAERVQAARAQVVAEGEAMAGHLVGVDRVLGLLTEERMRLFGELRHDWLGSRSAPFFRSAADLQTSLPRVDRA